ncbi:DUF5069 domain-containing protein [Synoicihabitans lomoniglobus]|uniref:DUF5069 domain-containing protein n=1 Tax=Synoicihabitans lomoniglobus TaxID=2909285 RepID=A0AAF0I612_9BACT|nr:DUF5069 domain-containing protein [Opitutaceae bacterium LMO-M01]WED67305.1 DUF5069 domain-containing protein [Opitutaceae bacterium LMO-M01]
MTPSHFNFPNQFRTLYDKAVVLYRSGQRGAENYFNADESAWLSANGLTAQTIYDYAEDDVSEGTPGFAHAAAIESVRRDYFFNVQQAVASTVVADASSWPGKSETLEGITWLPRILPKARAKLRGELPASMMYCCGGDRHFFRTHDINPAEFLNLIWRCGDDDAAIAAWVKARSRAPVEV